jgi:hypothetical protein
VAASAARELGVVPDLALQRHVADKTDIGFGIEPRQVAGVGIAIRIAVGHNRPHRVAPRAGARIETAAEARSAARRNVAPRAGARIETSFPPPFEAATPASSTFPGHKVLCPSREKLRSP